MNIAPSVHLIMSKMTYMYNSKMDDRSTKLAEMWESGAPYKWVPLIL